MKRIIGLSSAILLVTGCATHESGRVQTTSSGTKTYGLDEQPQTSVTGEGTLMPGAYDPGTPRTGQFTGLERSQAQVGQYPVPPREADVREFARTPEQVGTGILEPGTGAGSLGQVGIEPGNVVSSATLGASPTNPSLTPSQSASISVNPPTVSTAPTLAQPLTNPQVDNTESTVGVGRGPGVQSGSSVLDSSVNLRGTGPQLTTVPGADTTDLGARIRQNLLTATPDQALHPTRLDNLEVESLDGNVTLRGDVRSQAEKMLLGQRVSRMDGVRSVNNQLRVISPTRPEMRDATSPAERTRILPPDKNN